MNQEGYGSARDTIMCYGKLKNSTTFPFALFCKFLCFELYVEQDWWKH